MARVAQLTEVGAATREMRGVAEQALRLVRTGEERVTAAEQALVEAEARAETGRDEVKVRAKKALTKIGEEGRQRVAAERQRRRDAERRVARAEDGRRRAEKAYETARLESQGEREKLATELASTKGKTDEIVARAVKRTEEEASKRTGEVLEKAQAEADRRVAAAEQRAAEAEARAEEAHRTAVQLEAEIEERVMQGTVEVRREAEERVAKLVEKVEGEAEDKARVRAEEQLRAESERIRGQAEQREERLRLAAEEEIKASAKRARREVLAAADNTAPVWSRNEPSNSGSGYRTF